MLSIRLRLVLLTMFSIAAIFGISGFGIYYFAQKDLLERFDRQLQVQAYSIMTSTFQKEDENLEVYFTDRYLEEFSGNQRRTFYQIWKSEGEVIKRSESMGNEDLPQKYGKAREPKYWNLQLPNGLNGRAIGIRYEPQVRGNRAADYNQGFKIVLVVAADVDEVESSLIRLRDLLLLGAAATLILSPVFVLLVLNGGLAPLKELAGRMGNVDVDTLETHFDEDKLPSELKPIAGQLNELFSRLKRSFERERQFSADVSHELRTPIAAMLNIAEVGIKWKDGDSKQDYVAIRNISEEMQRTVAQLLDLSRADSGHIEIHPEPLALQEVVLQIWNRHVLAATQRNIKVAISGLEGVVWTVDRALFERMVDNLIQNAVTYTPDGGEVRILVTEDGGAFVFANTCTDLESADLDKLFDRFWRKDSARSSTEHRGLGLAVVAAFAEQQELQLQVRLTDEDFFEISIRNPLFRVACQASS